MVAGWGFLSYYEHKLRKGKKIAIMITTINYGLSILIKYLSPIIQKDFIRIIKVISIRSL